MDLINKRKHYVKTDRHTESNKINTLFDEVENNEVDDDAKENSKEKRNMVSRLQIKSNHLIWKLGLPIFSQNTICLLI